MNRILKRPMFRKGGSVDSGIVSGMESNRTNFQGGTTEQMIKDRARLYQQYAGDPLANLLITGGLNLVSGKGAGKGTLGGIAESFREPTERALTQQQQINLKAVGDVLSEEQAMRLVDKKERNKFKTLALFQTARAQLVQEGNTDPTDLEIQQRAGLISKQGAMRQQQNVYLKELEDIKGEFTIPPTSQQAEVIYKFRKNVKPKLDKSERQLGRQTIKSKDIKDGKASKKSAGVYINIDTGQVVRVDQNGTVVVDEALTAQLNK